MTTAVLAKGASMSSGRPSSSSDVHAEVVIATPVWAAAKLQEWHYELQRNIMESNIERLTFAITGRQFVKGTPIFVCRIPGGTCYLVNGYHTLHSIVRSGVPIVLTVITLDVADMNAVGRVYGTFDIQRTRSYAASWKAFKGSDPAPLEIKALSGVPFIFTDFRAGGNLNALTRQDRMELLQEYIGTGVLNVVSGALKGGEGDLVRAATRSGSMAVLLYTMRYQPSAAEDFWHSVVTDSAPDKLHPTRVLAKYFRQAKGAGSAFQQKDIDTCVLAWNNAWVGNQRERFKPSAFKNFRILGTPWHKGKP